jgi:hypothetical protein
LQEEQVELRRLIALTPPEPEAAPCERVDGTLQAIGPTRPSGGSWARRQHSVSLAARYTSRRKPPGDLAMTLTLFAALELSTPAYLTLAEALDAR